MNAKTMAELQATYLEVRAGVRYWEDATINGEEDEDGKLTPLRDGEHWVPVIRMADGQVMDWPQGTTADIHFKICDDGEYWLQNDQRERVAKWSGFYVPDSFLCPQDNGYGDYIIMTINEDGVIAGWQQPEVQEVCKCRDCDDDQSGWERLPA